MIVIQIIGHFPIFHSISGADFLGYILIYFKIKNAYLFNFNE